MSVDGLMDRSASSSWLALTRELAWHSSLTCKSGIGIILENIPLPASNNRGVKSFSLFSGLYKSQLRLFKIFRMLLLLSLIQDPQLVDLCRVLIFRELGFGAISPWQK
jgi:hypothetical protein